MVQELFSARQRIRRWKAVASAFHLLSVAVSILCILLALPYVESRNANQITQEWKEEQESRQMLIETLDRLVRYQRYFHDIYGRYTRDLSRILLPNRLATGDLEQLRRSYEISVIEVQPKRFLILATGIKNTDRITVDESHRLNANFSVPAPSRAYLLEEADRLLGLRAQGLETMEGFFSGYWEIGKGADDQSWFAVGLKNPVRGERRELQGEKALANIFAVVSEKLKNAMSPSGDGHAPASVNDDAVSSEIVHIALFKEALTPSDVQEWLEAARLAQHIHKRERGVFARRWEQLDLVSEYHFEERMKYAKNVRVHPIEVSLDERDFHFTIEGTNGDLMGEQFVMDRSGSMRQIRYTDALIHQLQEGTNLLENTFHFQINPIADDAARPSSPGKR